VRAAILIGVNKTGGLPVLSAAVTGARRMEAWALDQGMARKHVHLFTDEKNVVEIAAIKRVIRDLVDSGTITQLVIYFAGHGVNIRYGEYWLLSDAPVDASAAVNVEGSVVLARRSGIDHVVFISDACRTAAEGVQAQGITGSELFPNDPVDGPERAVDLFFATTLGRPALEVKTSGESAAAFHAVYTSTLLDAVGGKLPPAVQQAPGETPGFVVRPRSLKECLRTEMPRRLAGLRVGVTVSQEPDARITSDEAAWIAGFDTAPVAEPVASPCIEPPLQPVPRGGAPRLGLRTPPVQYPSAGAAARAFASRQLDQVLAGANSGGTRTATRGPSIRPMPDGPSPALAKPFGPLGFETNCGFKLRGAKLADAVASGVRVERFDDDASLARVHPQGRPANVLLILADQTSVLLPAVPGFVAALSFDAGELADVAYEPSKYGERWADFAQRADELRRLRAVIAQAAREGVFRLEGPAALARRMQLAKGVDPSLALYAAYAYHGLQQGDRLREMREYLRMDLGISFFDLDLLAGALPSGGEAGRYPPVPLLAQGWSLLSAFGVSLSNHLTELPASLGAPHRPLQAELVDTLWTQFKPAGTEHLRKLIQEGKLQ